MKIFVQKQEDKIKSKTVFQYDASEEEK